MVRIMIKSMTGFGRGKFENDGREYIVEILAETIIKNNIVSFILLTAGAVIAAFSLEEFLVPNNIFDGGITGVSMIIGNSSKIPLAALITAINIPFLFVALKKLGKR